MQSEAYYATSGSSDFWGGYVEASYFLTGEHRSYNRQKKEITKLNVTDDFINVLTADGLRKRGMGAWELKARWSYVDLNHGADPSGIGLGPSRGTQSNFLAGFNWYLNAYTRVMFDYLYEDVDLLTGVKGHTHTVGTRMQVHW